MEREYTLGLYEKSMPSDLSWEQKMLSAKAAGFDYIEISIDETDTKLARLDMSKEERVELVRLMMMTGVPIRSMCLSGHRKYPFGINDPEIEKRGMEIMEKAIRLAEDLAAHRMRHKHNGKSIFLPFQVPNISTPLSIGVHHLSSG